MDVIKKKKKKEKSKLVTCQPATKLEHTLYHPEKLLDYHEVGPRYMPKKSNSAVNLPRYENGISSSTLTNPLHRIFVQPSSAQKGMPSDPNQRTKETEKKEYNKKNM
jgi:hypothetical protein